MTIGWAGCVKYHSLGTLSAFTLYHDSPIISLCDRPDAGIQAQELLGDFSRSDRANSTAPSQIFDPY